MTPFQGLGFMCVFFRWASPIARLYRPFRASDTCVHISMGFAHR